MTDRERYVLTDFICALAIAAGIGFIIGRAIFC
jgi:ElaB/YqjD/DUF883 family membrane-anchored ribosome-binding protein